MADMSAVQILWHVEGASNLRGIVVDPRIAKLGQAARSNLTMATFYAGFGGLCIALFVYNLALWGALRHRFPTAYCAMVGAPAAYAFSRSEGRRVGRGLVSTCEFRWEAESEK